MRISIKKSVWIMIIFAISIGLAGSVCGAGDTQKSDTDKPSADYIARVNGVEISQVELDRKFNLIKERYANMGVPLDDAKLKEFKDNILKSLIEQEVLFQESIAQGIKVDPEEIKAELDKFKKQFETEAAFEKQIEQMNYTEDAILAQIKQSKTIQEYIEKNVMPTIEVTDEDARAYFDEHPEEFKVPERVHASHILLKVDPEASEESKAKSLKEIKAIKSQLDNGEEFAKLASSHSDCPSSAKGGDLGFFGHGQMVKPFEEAAFALEPGEISDVVETRFGYHLIQSQEKEKGTTLTYADVKENLIDKLKQDQFKAMFPSYIESLKAKYEVELLAEEVDAPADTKPSDE